MSDIIICTGASQGIGYQLCKDLASYPNLEIWAVARNEKKLQELRNTVADLPSGNALRVFSGDITEVSFMEHLGEQLQKTKLPLKALVNNAGKLIHKPFEEISSSEWSEIFKVNVFSVVELIKVGLPYFQKGKAHILNISSMGGVGGTQKFPGLAAYSASKGALGILTESLAVEFEARGIHVNALALGAVQTEMLNHAFGGKVSAPISAEEMGHYVSHFVREGYRLFNGKVLPVAVSTP